jgi:hypothetical protein
VTHATPARLVHRAQEAFLAGEHGASRVRDLVAESWFRSVAAGLDTERAVAPITLEDVGDYRAAHPLSPVFPLLYDVLGRAAEACDSVLAIGDAAGQLLWVCGTPAVLRKAEQINFVEGAGWAEASAGTNAPGTALRLDAPVQIRGAEHFTRAVQRWSCAAAPIHDPATQAILGVVDITGGPDVESPQTLAMVRAAARMAEAELGRLQLLASAGRPDALLVPARSRHADEGPSVLIDGLGRPDCHLTHGTRTLRLSPRHSEILVILSRHPDGLTSEQLALQLYRDDGNLSTLRAEVTRLRALLGPELLDSRPYRLRAVPECDWAAIEAHLAAGRLTDAVRGYRGPLLPQSEAPGVVALRESLEQRMRNALLRSGSTDLMIAWTRSRWGADDLEMWEELSLCLQASSPLRAIADAEVGRLNRELGL